jgi:hypothetical protein
MVEPGIMLPRYLMELDNGFTIEEIGKNLMKTNNFPDSDGMLVSTWKKFGKNKKEMRILMDIFNALDTNLRFIFRTISDLLDYKKRHLLYRAESLFVRRSVQKT